MRLIENLIREKCEDPDDAERLISMIISASTNKNELISTINDIKEAILND